MRYLHSSEKNRVSNYSLQSILLKVSGQLYSSRERVVNSVVQFSISEL